MNYVVRTAALFVLVTLPAPAAAQVQVLRADDAIIVPAAGQANDAIQQQKARYAQAMAVHIDELDRVCSLSDVQRRKLQLASKGAIVTAMEEWKVTARMIQDRLGGRAVLAAPVARPAGNRAGVDEKKDENDDGEDEEPALRIDSRLLSIMNASGYLPEPQQQSRWVKAVSSVLSDDQKTKVRAAESARLAYRRRFGVATYVDQLDYVLRFSPEQREQATKIVDSVMGRFLEGEIAPGRNVYVYGDVPEIRTKHLRPILSEAQAAAWKRHVDGQANPLNGVIMGPGFRRAMPGIRGRALPRVTLGMAFVAGPLSTGVRVDYLAPDGPSAKAGLKVRDLLKSIDGQPLRSWVQVNSALRNKQPGDKVTLVVTRNGEEQSIEVETANRDPDGKK